jgi:hypothetical protein
MHRRRPRAGEAPGRLAAVVLLGLALTGTGGTVAGATAPAGAQGDPQLSAELVSQPASGSGWQSVPQSVLDSAVGSAVTSAEKQGGTAVSAASIGWVQPGGQALIVGLIQGSQLDSKPPASSVSGKVCPGAATPTPVPGVPDGFQVTCVTGGKTFNISAFRKGDVIGTVIGFNALGGTAPDPGPTLQAQYNKVPSSSSNTLLYVLIGAALVLIIVVVVLLVLRSRKAKSAASSPAPQWAPTVTPPQGGVAGGTYGSVSGLQAGFGLGEAAPAPVGPPPSGSVPAVTPEYDPSVATGETRATRSLEDAPLPAFNRGTLPGSEDPGTGEVPVGGGRLPAESEAQTPVPGPTEAWAPPAPASGAGGWAAPDAGPPSGAWAPPLSPPPAASPPPPPPAGPPPDPGWHHVAGDPHHMRYWDGVAWTAEMRWNGTVWEDVPA